jgi:MoaA/NifB/PqqE/SkfB family radical SAM enzyme
MVAIALEGKGSMQPGSDFADRVRGRLATLWGRLWGQKIRLTNIPAAVKTNVAAAGEGALATEDQPADTFCVLAWNHFQITPNGTVKMCCIASEDVHDDKRPMSLYTDTYESIWNSPYMQRARRAMAEGKHVPACMRCYREEKSVGESLRMVRNEMWLTGSERSREQLIDEARTNDWKVPSRPIFLQLNMGNLCNLACRMCTSQYSSKIENDPVHSKWVPAVHPEVARWRGKKLHFGPRPFFGVGYKGFHDYEVAQGASVRWTTGDAAIRIPVPKETIVTAVGLKLRAVDEPVEITVRVNGLEIFEGQMSREGTYRHEFKSLVNHSELEIEIDAPATSAGWRVLGVGLLDAWIERASPASETLKNERTLMRLPINGGWWTQPEVMFDEILGEPAQLRYMILQGGEPFLVKEFDDILDRLIQCGSAGEVTFEIVSNLTVLKESTLERLAQLKQVLLGASIDGIGPVLEYIRYPAEWAVIERNLARAATLSNVKIGFNTAVQAYNLLDLTNILQYCDEREIDVNAHFLVGPRYLNVTVLPRKVREVAIDRLSSYLHGSPRPANRTSAEYSVKFLREHLTVQHREDFDDFVKFTNDMDVSRGQNFHSHYPDLVAWFAEDDLHWSAETLHAHRVC